MKVTIVGGGIGGLTAFHRRGWQVEVLERAPDGRVYCYLMANAPMPSPARSYSSATPHTP